MKLLKRLLKYTLFAVLLFVLYIVVILVHGTSTDYQPKAKTTLNIDRTAALDTIKDSVLTFVNWNIGYSGLGEECDFFYDNGYMFTDGGKMVQPPRAVVEKNIKGVYDYIKNTPADFYLIQEIDTNSKRSFYENQYAKSGDLLPNYSATFATNFNVKRVPVPILQPWNVIGKAMSGLGTYARFQPTEAIRYQMPGKFEWPTRIFQLDRCVSVQRYPMQNGKELIVVNAHLSAFDDGSLKAAQMAFLEELLKKEYETGNYIVVGADWNQCPPDFVANTLMLDMPKGDKTGYTQINVPEVFIDKGWKWVYDKTTPTNRKMRHLYDKERTFRTVIDFYLVSPNVEVLEVKTSDLEFKYSDHQPVVLKAKFQ